MIQFLLRGVTRCVSVGSARGKVIAKKPLKFTHLVFIYAEELLYWSVRADREGEKKRLHTFNQRLTDD